MKRILMKADLHVHSKFSKRPSEWILRKLGCAESYTEPEKLYAMAKMRGMDFVTITDHNTLSGSLEIAHHDDTFVSEEVTTYFPDDRCKLHVVVFNIDESIHEDISRVRDNVFDLVAYLHKEQIRHSVAHPLFAINKPLTPQHIEKLLLLFKNFELNGSRDDFQNRNLQRILESITKEDIERLSDKYDVSPYGSQPWEKNLVGGSDDHSSLNIASTYTEMIGVTSIEEFLAGIDEGKGEVRGLLSSPKTLGHNFCSIAYQFYSDKLRLQRYVNKDVMMKFIHRTLIPVVEHEDEGLVERIKSALAYRRSTTIFRSKSKSMQALLQQEARDIIFKNPELSAMLNKTRHRTGEMEDAWFEFLNQISERVLRSFADSILDSFSGANLFDIFHTIGSAGSLYTILAPYFVSYAVFTKDRRFCRECMSHFIPPHHPAEKDTTKIAHFTDTFDDVNGVALTLKMQVETALKNDKQLSIITCGHKEKTPGVRNFEPIGVFDMPEYPGLRIYYPPLLNMLDYCYEQDFSRIHSATPGPIGLAALAIARILKMPIDATYHTALPQYARQLTGDQALEEITWKFMVWYYNQMDAVYVPSHATKQEIVEKGVKEHKIRFYERGIDVERFNPSKRNGFLRRTYNLGDDVLKLLYVGRISKEKNLPSLVDACRQLASMRSGFHLVVVGDGPYADEMKTALQGMPVTFAGLLYGEDLAQAYASSDLFLFPSATDTFGNVVLEAQASGLPVIVSDKGGPQENIVPEETGFVVPAGDSEALTKHALRLIDDPSLLVRMKENAREYAEKRSFETAYMQLWESYRAQDNHANGGSRDIIHA